MPGRNILCDGFLLYPNDIISAMSLLIHVNGRSVSMLRMVKLYLNFDYNFCKQNFTIDFIPSLWIYRIWSLFCFWFLLFSFALSLVQFNLNAFESAVRIYITNIYVFWLWESGGNWNGVVASVYIFHILHDGRIFQFFAML